MAALQDWWKSFSASPTGQLVQRAGRMLFFVGIFGYLAYKLSEIGWRDVWEALPTNPLFYFFFLLLYFSLPIAEVFIYRVTWTFHAWRSFPAFVKKRIFNKDVMGYSGEVYFYSWARKNVGLTDGDIGRTIRDNNILSFIASTLVALVLVLLFLFIGEINVMRIIEEYSWTYLLIIPIGLVMASLLLYRYREYLYSMTLRVTLIILAIQIGRLLIGQVLQIAQWAVVMPDVSMGAWFTLAAISIVLTRIPFLPNHSLVLMGVSVEMATNLGIPEAGLFSMMGMLAALDKGLNVALFAAASYLERQHKRNSPEDPDVSRETADEADVNPVI